MAKASWNGKVIAESDTTELVEGNIYFPESSLKREYFRPSSTISTCPWKGQARYYSLLVDGQENQDAAWYYPDPKPAARNVKNHVAFGAELKSRSRRGASALLLGVLLLPWGRLTAQPRDIEVLHRLEEDYLRAEIEDDTAIASAVLADDYVGLRGDGTSSSKADVLSSLGRHDRQRQPYEITAINMREHVFGDTACLTYTKVYTRPGSQGSFSENVLHVLIRRNGVWRLQLSSPVAANRK